MMHTFNSQVQFVNSMQASYAVETVKNEPMLFACDLFHAYEIGGPITKDFLRALPRDWAIRDVVIDTKVCMLKPGFMPCIGGWHHDDVARYVRDNDADVKKLRIATPDGQGQPAYGKGMPYKSEHLTCFVFDSDSYARNGHEGYCNTEFAIGTHSLPEVEKGVVYEHWNKIVNEQLGTPQLKSMLCKAGELYAFDWQSMHRGTASTSTGWRWWARVSRKTRRHAYNERRHQVQVYLQDMAGGW